VLLFTPESPWWLIRNGKIAEAAKVVKRLGKVPREHSEQYLAMLVRTTEIEARVTAGASYKECFKGTALRRTLYASLTTALTAGSCAAPTRSPTLRAF
jgi:SP family general alpha glucoside:H+ symporter-like MFS transporter